VSAYPKRGMPPSPFFFEHPALWWAGLNAMERLGVVAVVIGLCAATIPAWFAAKRWWRRVKLRGPTDGDLP
jgi:hypothetical protein